MRRYRILRCCGSGLLALSVSLGGVCGSVWGDDVPALRAVSDDAPQLQAVPPLLPLADRVPVGLDIESLDNLGENWRPWVEETAGLIADLYENAESDADQVRAIEELRRKLGTMHAALGDPRYAKIHPQLRDLQGKLTRRLELFLALREVLGGPAPPPESVASTAIQDLRTALAELESTLIVIPQGAAWFPYLMTDELDLLVGRGAITDADRTLLETARQRLVAPQGLEPAQAEFLRQPMFQRLAAALGRALSSAGGDYAPGLANPLAEVAAQLVAAQEEYEQSGSRQAAAEILAALETLKGLGGGAPRLVDVVQRHYMGHNLQLVVTESFMQPLFSDYRRESGGVAECILEAWVTGCQWTNTKVSVDVRPSSHGARFVLMLDGDVYSSTQGEVPNATVYTKGTARFHAEKEIIFDGECFQLCPSRIGVNARNCSYDADTCLNWMPIASRVARNYALDQAEEKRPESEAYARWKISREVRTRFDRETRQQFSDAERKLQSDLYGPLGELQLKPELIQLSSSDVDLTVRERLMGGGQLSGGLPPQAMVPPKGLLVQIHQSLLNNGVDRMGIAGERLTRTELDERIQSRLDKVFKNRKKKADHVPPEPGLGEPPAEAAPSVDDNTKLIFDTVDPISFRFEDGAMVMSLRAGLERPGEEDIPTQIISVPLLMSIEGDQVVLTRGTVGVKPVERPRNLGEQITRAQIMRKRVEDGIPERQTREATSELKQQGKVIPVRLTQIGTDDGWMTLTVE